MKPIQPIQSQPNQARFGAALPPSKLYQLSEQYLTADSYVKKWVADSLKSSGPIRGFFTKMFGRVGEELGKNDFAKFSKPNWPKLKFATPPNGALMWMMYIGLLGARAERAWERGKLPNGKRDYREMLDVFRRDMWGITLYIFGLFTINKWLARFTQQSSGLRLTDKTGDIIHFNAHTVNAYLDNPEVMAAQMKQGNLKGLIKAANHNGYLGVPKELLNHHPEGAKTLDKLIARFRSTLGPLAELDLKAVEAGKHNALIEKTAREAMPILEELGLTQAKLIKQLKGTQALRSAGWIGKWQPYKNFFSHYAKNQRAPIDLLSSITMFFLVGYGPIAFNKWWTERQYENRLKAIQHQHQTQNKPIQEATLKTTSSSSDIDLASALVPSIAKALATVTPIKSPASFTKADLNTPQTFTGQPDTGINWALLPYQAQTPAQSLYSPSTYANNPFSQWTTAPYSG